MYRAMCWITRLVTDPTHEQFAALDRVINAWGDERVGEVQNSVEDNGAIAHDDDLVCQH
jgi:hypothetical protein